MFKTKLLSFVLSTSAVLVAAPTIAAFAPVYAQTVNQTTDPTTQVPSEQPTVNFSYRAPNFYITIPSNVKIVKYSIDYIRSAGGAGDMEEGLMNGGTARRGRYSARVYAGTQSSHYFIPHHVKSATLHLTGTTLDGTPFTYDTQITVAQPVVKKKAPVVRRKITVRRTKKVVTAPVTPTPSY